MAFVLFYVALSWPMFLAASLAFVTALLVIRLDRGPELVGALLLACVLVGPLVVLGIPVDCSMRCFAIECWWFCL